MVSIALALSITGHQNKLSLPDSSNAKLAERVFLAVAKHCAPCHSGAKNATFALRSRDDLFRYARGMAGEVLKLRMPPGSTQGDFGSYCANGGLTPVETSDIWEWSNRVEQNRLKPSDAPKVIPYLRPIAAPKSDLVIKIPMEVPAEAKDGLNSISKKIKFSKNAIGQRLDRFWVETNLPARVLTAELTTANGEFLSAWSVGTRPWNYGTLGPEIPPRAAIRVVSTINGEALQGFIRLCFRLSPVGNSAWSPLSQNINSNSPVQTVVPRAGKLLAFFPVFGANVESWRARLWQPQTGWKVVASHPSATSRSIGAYLLSRPISLSPGDILNTEVRYRRGRNQPLKSFWAISETH